MSDLIHPVTGEPMESLPATMDAPCRHIFSTREGTHSYCGRLVQLTVQRYQELREDGRLDSIRCLEHSGHV